MVAVDVGVDRIAVALVGLGGEVLDRRTRGHQRGEHDVAHVVDVGRPDGRGDARRRSPHIRCLGVGVAVPGAVRAERRPGPLRARTWAGSTSRSPTSWPSGSDGRSRPATTPTSACSPSTSAAWRSATPTSPTSTPASVSVAASCSAVGRWAARAGTPARSATCRSTAPGPVCRCGAVGCWETKVGENVLLRRAGRLAGGGPPAVAEVIAAAQAGEARAEAAVDDVAEWCGVGHPRDRQPVQPRDRRARRLPSPRSGGPRRRGSTRRSTAARLMSPRERRGDPLGGARATTRR